MPVTCGCTIPTQNVVVMAASTADPPNRKIPNPISEQIFEPDTTAPWELTYK